MRTIQDLQQMQACPLDVKILLTKSRIRQWINEYGEDGVYISFSGGKDSTVLLDLVRQDYPNVKAMFVDVPTQYPELKEFVKTFDNVDIVRPKITFMQVCEKYGFPLISKEVSECVSGARKYLTRLMAENSLNQPTNQPIRYEYSYNKLCGLGKYQRNDKGGGRTTSIENSEELANMPQRLAIVLGKYDEWYQVRKGNIPREDGNRSIFSQEKYKFFLDAPFEISNRCCNVMKKEPAHKYYKETGRKPIIATMASESRLRTQKWIQSGCNGFNLTIPTSTPMSFWTEQDVLLYIKTHNLPICSVYGEVVRDYDGTDNIEGQMDLSELDESLGVFDTGRPLLKTTGCSRTGCVLCGFGCHLEKEGEGRFELLKKTHPKLYGLLDVVENNGVTMREAVDWINEHGNMNIKY